MVNSLNLFLSTGIIQENITISWLTVSAYPASALPASSVMTNITIACASVVFHLWLISQARVFCISLIACRPPTLVAFLSLSNWLGLSLVLGSFVRNQSAACLIDLQLLSPTCLNCGLISCKSIVPISIACGVIAVLAGSPVVSAASMASCMSIGLDRSVKSSESLELDSSGRTRVSGESSVEIFSPSSPPWLFAKSRSTVASMPCSCTFSSSSAALAAAGVL